MPTGTWPLGWATGDVVTASEFAKGVGAIFDTTVAVAAATIDITPIVATYAHLQLKIVGRGDSGTGVAVFAKFNNDSGANYDHQRNASAGTGISSAEALASTSLQLGNIPGGSDV